MHYEGSETSREGCTVSGTARTAALGCAVAPLETAVAVACNDRLPRLCFLSRLPGAPSGTFTNLFSLGSSEWVLFKAMTPDPGSEQDGSRQRATRPQRPSRVLSVGAAAPRGRVTGRARGEEPGALAQLCLQLVLAPACARLLDLPGSLGGSSGTERCPGRSRPRSLPV